MDDCIESLGDSKASTALEAIWGYWKVPIKDEDKDKTTFTSNLETYPYARMPLGLWNGPAKFQRALDNIIYRVRWEKCFASIEEVVIISKKNLQHVKDIEEVLKLLSLPEVILSEPKCHFFQIKIEYFEHVIMPGRLDATCTKTNAIKAAVLLTDGTQIRSFLCACNV